MADVGFRLLVTGPKQPVQEVGAFEASLPLGKSGGFEREVTIENAAKEKKTSVRVALTLTPSAGEDGALHCTVLSDAAPSGGKVVSRARDLVFDHPGEQVMELFADPATGAHLLIAVEVVLPASNAAPPPLSWPFMRFEVRVERFAGSERSVVDEVELLSHEGREVSHYTEKRLPRLEEGEAPAQETSEADLIPLAPKGLITTYPLQPLEDQPPGSPGSEPPPKPPKTDSRVPKPGEQLSPAAAPRHIEWGEEKCSVVLVPITVEGELLTARVEIRGQVLDPATNKAIPVSAVEEARPMKRGEASTFTLSGESSAGAAGFAVRVLPVW